MNDNFSATAKTASGTAAALLAAALFGILVPCSKALLEQLSPLWFAALLLIGAGLAVACVLVPRTLLGISTVRDGDKDNRGAFSTADTPKLALMACLNAVAVACLAFGIANLAAADASLAMCFEIAAMTVCAWLLFGRHVCLKAGAAVALICLATVLLFFHSWAEGGFAPASLLIVVAGVLRGIESGLKRSFADRNPFAITFVRNLGAGIALLVMAIVAGGPLVAGPVIVLEALALGALTFGAAATLHLTSLRQVGPARSESYFAVAPFVGLILSWAFFGFELNPLFFGAIAFMALGVWLAMDDSVFHEDVFAEANEERLALYTSEGAAFGFDYMHRPL